MILVFRSLNFKEWKYRGPLFVSDYVKYPYLGTAWELPVLLPLKRKGQDSGKHVFLISPWGPGSKVEVMYWIGTFDKSECRFIPDHEQPLLIDVGDFHFTGPSGMVDPLSGRSLLFTIAQGERTPEIDYDCGWSHSAGLPVALYLREDGQLGVEPIEEISQLRGKQLYSSAGRKAMDEINFELADVHGDLLEIMIDIESPSAKKYGISIRRSPNGEEETVIYYDRVNKELMVNREKTTLDDRERSSGIQGGSLLLEEGERLQLRIFVDRSLIEGYANGLKSLTTRAYPSRTDATGLRIWADGLVERVSIEVWEMSSVFEAGPKTS
nr:GH32 C-terminal domain-containing protein [Cohnella luojiensis]